MLGLALGIAVGVLAMKFMREVLIFTTAISGGMNAANALLPVFGLQKCGCRTDRGPGAGGSGHCGAVEDHGKGVKQDRGFFCSRKFCEKCGDRGLAGPNGSLWNLPMTFFLGKVIY